LKQYDICVKRVNASILYQDEILIKYTTPV